MNQATMSMLCSLSPRSHSITQAVGDLAVIMSRDQESELKLILMSSLKVPCKKP